MISEATLPKKVKGAAKSPVGNTPMLEINLINPRFHHEFTWVIIPVSRDWVMNEAVECFLSEITDIQPISKLL